MKEFFSKIKKTDEKGIALLFTLGVLSLLLVLAVAFATTSMSSRKMAANNGDVSSARMLANGALQKAMSIMRLYSAHGFPIDGVVSHVENADASYYDFLWRMETQVEGSYYMDWPGYNDTDAYDPADDSSPNWHYVFNGKTDNDSRVIGRYAYKVVSSGGKLDPSVSVAHSTDFIGGVQGAKNERTIVNAEIRNGFYQHEINIKNLDLNNATSSFLAGGLIPDEIVSQMSSTSAPVAVPGVIPTDRRLPDTKRWVDFETMFSSSNLNITDSNQKSFFKECFVVDNPKDPEAFWVDKNNDGALQTDTELYHRFNLARTDWDTTFTGITAVDKIIANATKFDNSSSHNGSGIQWLKNYPTDAASPTWKGTFSDNQTRAKQIAANIIDYCDSNRTPTSDSANWATTAPTYTGLEKTPYINEIGIRVEATATVAHSGAWNVDWYKYGFTIFFGAEYVNMFGSQGETFLNPIIFTIIDGSIKFVYTNPDGTESAEQSISLSGKSVTIANSNPYSMTFSSFATPTYGWTPQGVPTNKAEIRKVKLQISKAVLSYSGVNVDYVRPDSAGGYSDEVATLISQNGGATGHSTASACFSYQVDDPMQNLNDEDWGQAKQEKTAVYGSGGTKYGTLSAVNDTMNPLPIVTCTTSGDAEAGSTPTTISTAHIRNAPMRSPWELGAIHRGAKWETLNIKFYNGDDDKDGTSGEKNADGTEDNGASSSMGIGGYAKGDANILDQIKMTSDTQVYGKVGIQNANEYVLSALLADIRVGSAFYTGDPGNLTYTGSAPLSYTLDIGGPVYTSPSNRPSFLVGYVKKIIDAQAAATFKTRAQLLLQVNELYGGSTAKTPSGIDMDNDIKKEEIIGKFINLTKGSLFEDTVPIVVIAQAIRDTGSISGMAMKKDFNLDGDTTDAGYNGDNLHAFYGITGGVNETNNSVKLGYYDIGFDEIVGESKILAFVSIDPLTKKTVILKMIYMDNE